MTNSVATQPPISDHRVLPALSHSESFFFYCSAYLRHLITPLKNHGRSTAAVKPVLLIAGVLLLSSACKDNDSDANQFNLVLKSNSTIDVSIAKVRVVIYGFNASVVDNPATVITNNIIPISALPSDLTISWPHDAVALIDNPPVAAGQEARFYVNVQADIDDDGFICAGDLIQDYDVSPFQSFPSQPSSLTVSLKEKTTDDCQLFSQLGPATL